MTHHQDTKTPRKDLPPELEQLAEIIVDAAVKVHTALGPGLLESVYEACMAHEVRSRGLKVETQVQLPVIYKGIQVDAGLRIDLLVESKAVIELKAVDGLFPVHHAQILTYLKLSGHRLGFLMNFNRPLLKDGLHRRVL
jgi:GxxExxY protein